jgi:hypothetical protein
MLDAPPRPAAAAPTTYRAMRRGDLAEAAALFTDVMEMPAGASADVAAFFARAFFDCPWADPEIAPLVACDDATNRIVGMIGAETRRVCAGDRALRVACLGHLAVAPEARQGAAGVMLLRRALSGPQDVTVTDTASELVERIWTRLGGWRVELKAVHWVRVSRPWSVAARLAAPRIRRPRARTAVRTVAAGLDDATAKAAQTILEPPAVATTAESLTPELLLEHLPTVTSGLDVRPDYDLAFLDWLFAEMPRAPGRGSPIAHLVRDERGRALGWYVYYLRPGWRSEVLQVAARDRDLGAVVDHLVWHAHMHGSAVLRGRLEPGLEAPLAQRRCLLWHRGGALVHARDPELGAQVVERGMLTRLDSDWTGDTMV